MSCTHENKEIFNLGARKSKLARFVDKVNRARKITSKETTFSIYLKLSTGPGLAAITTQNEKCECEHRSHGNIVWNAAAVSRSKRGFAVNFRIRCHCKSLIGDRSDANFNWSIDSSRQKRVSVREFEFCVCGVRAAQKLKLVRLEPIKCKEKSHRTVGRGFKFQKKKSNSSLQQCSNLALLRCNVTLRPRKKKPNSLPSLRLWLCVVHAGMQCIKCFIYFANISQFAMAKEKISFHFFW